MTGQQLMEMGYATASYDIRHGVDVFRFSRDEPSISLPFMSVPITHIDGIRVAKWDEVKRGE